MIQTIVELFLKNPLGQTIGVFAYFITAIALSQKNDLRLRVLMTVSATVWALHFFLIGASTAGVMVSIIALRTSVTVFTIKSSYKIRFLLSVFFVSINFVGLFLTWHGLISILPFFSACLATISLFLFSRIKMRMSLIFVEISWLAHNILTGSLGGIISNLTNITILSVFVIKEYFTEKKNFS